MLDNKVKDGYVIYVKDTGNSDMSVSNNLKNVT